MYGILSITATLGFLDYGAYDGYDGCGGCGGCGGCEGQVPTYFWQHSADIFSTI